VALSGQEYNKRKNRKGAFWEDRYHATVIEKGEHLLRCIVYIDMNSESLQRPIVAILRLKRSILSAKLHVFGVNTA